MQSPTVLKAIYSLEHGQSTERLAQTLLRLGVNPAEVEEMTQNTPGGASANWMRMAERVASERAAHGHMVVAPDLLRAANTMIAKRDTVRIHVPRVNVVSPPPQGLVASPSAMPPTPSGPGTASPLTSNNLPASGEAPARRIAAVVVPVSPASRPWATGGAGAGPVAPNGQQKSALRTELEEVVRLLTANPDLESNGLSPAQNQALRDGLRLLLRAATQPPIAVLPNARTVLTAPRPISLRAQVKL